MKDKKLEAILGMMDADSEEAVLEQMNNLAKILAVERIKIALLSRKAVFGI